MFTSVSDGTIKEKIMNKLLKIALTLVVGICLTGCYNDFDNPGPARVYTDADFRPEQLISIKELKDMF